MTDAEHSLTPHRHAPQRMPLGGELGDVTNKLSALNVVDGADASKLQVRPTVAAARLTAREIPCN